MPFITRPVAELPEQVNIHDAYALNVWARHFNVPEKMIRDAVGMVGVDRGNVHRHLYRSQQINLPVNHEQHAQL